MKQDEILKELEEYGVQDWNGALEGSTSGLIDFINHLLSKQVVQSEVSEKVSDNFKKAFPYFIDEMKNLLYIQEKDELNKSGKIRLNELLFVNDLIKSPTPPDAEKWISVDEKPKTEGYYKDKEIAELKLRAEKWSDRAIELQSTIESQQKEIEELKAQRIVDAECISQSGAYRIESIKQIASLESQLSEVTKERDMLEKTCTRAQDHAEYLLSDSHILTPKIKTNR